MILETVLAAHLIFSSDIKAEYKKCEQAIYDINGCYDFDTKTIYIDTDNKGIVRESVIYHEFGHHLIKQDFDPEMFSPDQELMATWFVWWMFEQKAPGEYFKENYGQQYPKDKDAFFRERCHKECVNYIFEIAKQDNSDWEETLPKPKVEAKPAQEVKKGPVVEVAPVETVIEAPKPEPKKSWFRRLLNAITKYFK